MFEAMEGPAPNQSARRTGGVLPSRGTDGHSVHLLKTSLALYGGE